MSVRTALVAACRQIVIEGIELAESSRARRRLDWPFQAQILAYGIAGKMQQGGNLTGTVSLLMQRFHLIDQGLLAFALLLRSRATWFWLWRGGRSTDSGDLLSRDVRRGGWRHLDLFTNQIVLNSISQVFAHMPTIRDLQRLWSPLSGSISISSCTISADNLDVRMGSKPLLDTLSFSICKKVNQLMGFQINNDRSIAFSPFPGKIIDANCLDVAYGWSCQKVQRTQKRFSGEMNA